jgi:hypothetical protein
MRSIQTGTVVAGVISARLSGCVIDSGGGTPPVVPSPEPTGLVPSPEDSSTRGLLARPRTLSVLPGGRAHLTATRLWGDDYVVESEIPFLGGEIAVQAQPDGRITVVAAELMVGDVHLSALSVPPAGLELTGVVIRLPYITADAKWTEDGSGAAASARTELLLDWALLSRPGEIHPMATQHIRDVPFSLEVVTAKDGTLHAALHASREGIFFTWTGLFELADLTIDLEAVE